MDRWLLLARGWYLLVGAGGLLVAAGGIGGEVLSTPALVGGVVGILGLSAAAWVRSASVPRGMLASIGIPVGALAVASVALIWAVVVDAFGVLPPMVAYSVAAGPSAVAVSAAVIMWRRSTRPWDGAPPSVSVPPTAR